MSVSEKTVRESSPEMTLSERIVVEVANREETSPTELDACLYDAVDPDALEDLFASFSSGALRANGRVVFSFCGYEITVHSHDEIEVRPVEEAE